MVGKRGRKKRTYTRKSNPTLILNAADTAGPSKSRKNNNNREISGTSPVKDSEQESPAPPPIILAESTTQLSNRHSSLDEAPDNFDNLIDPNYKSNFSNKKKIRTYVNKSKKNKVFEQQELLEFQNDSNRDSIIKWLNDNKNTFDRLTQTQCNCCDEISVGSMDITSVSQNIRPYNLRPRYSLEIKREIKKKKITGKSLRHSLAGDTPSMENYHIEDFYTDNDDDEDIVVPVETSKAKFLINLMEDEYLTSLQQEINNQILAETDKKHNSSGWDRFNYVNTARRQPKKLKINEQSQTASDQSRSYDCAVLEEYFSKNMKKLLEAENINCYEEEPSDNTTVPPDPLTQTAETLLTNLLNLNKENVSSNLRDILLRLNAAITELTKAPTSCSASTQTELFVQKADKQSQVEVETSNVANQTEQVEEVEKQDAAIQVNPEYCSVETQTEPCLKNEEAHVEDAHDSLDGVLFDTDELLNNCEKQKNQQVSGSVLECTVTEAPAPPEIVNVSKRSRSPSRQEETPAKRPCNKFVNDDLSIDFDSCAQNDKIIVLSDSEEILNNIEFRVQNAAVSKPTRSRTQELIEECDMLIYNATKPQQNFTTRHKKKQQENDGINLEVEGEKQHDLDYFETDDQLLQEKTPKSRRSLFAETRGKFSESAFTSRHHCSQPAPLKDISFNSSNNNNIHNKDEEDNFERIINQISTPALALPPGNSSHKENYNENCRKKNDSKIIILENILLKQANEDDDDDDEDIIDTTPQKPCSFSTKYRNSLLSLPPPPVEFQDTENDHEITLIPGTPPSPPPPRAISSHYNKITSTPLSNRPDSELISMSAIPLEEPICNKPIQLVQRQVAASLTGSSSSSRKTPPPSTHHQRSSSSHHKHQNSILNYLNKSLESSSSLLQSKKPCIACSRLSKDQVLGITALANKKLATYSSTFSGKVSHMVVATNEKNWTRDHTMKYVSGVAAGIWILNYKWVEKSLASGFLVDEEEYEVLDVTGVDGPKQSRLNHIARPLFRGYKVHVAPPFSSTTREEVERVIELMGGRVVATPDDLLERNKIRLIITEAKATEEYDVYESWLQALQVITVDLEWLSRSVGEYKLIPFQPFVLCSEDDLEGLDYPPELLLPSAL